jgi:ubiquinone/menaquinone biosynthesis C-methylase UbiE
MSDSILTKQSIKELKELYDKGENIEQYLRNKYGVDKIIPEITELSFDMQAGSSISFMQNNAEQKKINREMGAEISRRIFELVPNVNSILEAGMGEGIMLSSVLAGLKNHSCENQPSIYGFDISWSRVAYAKQNCTNATVFTADMFQIPCAENSVDIVFTSFALAYNAGREHLILSELFRTSKKYVLLLEPSFEWANDEQKQRMRKFKYVEGLYKIVESLGYKVVEHSAFPYYTNPLTPLALTIIEKKEHSNCSNYVLADPQFKTSLQEIDGALFSPDSLRVYPIIGGIPCLRVENSIVASKYGEFHSPLHA